VTPQAATQDQVGADTPDVYTMRQLNQNTASVIEQVEKNGAALITRLGRFVAVIRPLKADVESRALSDIARDIGKQVPGASSQVSDYKPDVYTVRQLGQQTAFVIDQIGKKGPALITRRGSFVAVIIPLKGDVESRVLRDIARDIGKQASGT
jgi:antitoxin (DNA-binding transcriptional repressor) of toxin-antitoxin stability system